MSLVAKTEGGNSNFVPVPTGMHLARCYRIIDLGTQESTYMGNVKQLHKLDLANYIHHSDYKKAGIVLPHANHIRVACPLEG